MANARVRSAIGEKLFPIRDSTGKRQVPAHGLSEGAEGYTPVVLVKSAQTVERKGDELSLFAKE